MKRRASHRQLCTIELVAEGHADRCPGEECVFWDSGCVLTRIECELEGRPDVARLLVELRSELAAGKKIETDDLRSRFARLLNEDEGIV
jgi:hypothetical protein